MKYIVRDREGNEYIEHESFAVNAFYGNPVGRSVVKVFSMPVFSKVAGKFLDGKTSRVMIKKFVKKNDIDVNEFEDKKYKSFNDFFTRKRKDLKIKNEKNILVSPSDARLMVLKIDENGIFNIKGANYNISDLLDEDAIYNNFIGGDLLIFRLCKDDYHRYHYIDNGVQGKSVFIPGTLNTVRPIALRKVKVFKRNAREYTVLHTNNFDDVVQVEVGAILVGRIVNIHHGEYAFKKGEEKGYFEFGGSTIVLMFKKDIIELDEDIVNNSSEDVETLVKVGTKIGIKK